MRQKERAAIGNPFGKSSCSTLVVETNKPHASRYKRHDEAHDEAPSKPRVAGISADASRLGHCFAILSAVIEERLPQFKQQVRSLELRSFRLHLLQLFEGALEVDVPEA